MSPLPHVVFRKMWYAPSAKRHFATKMSACIGEARARIKRKHPPERSEYDDRGQCVEPGWSWHELPRSDVLLKRYAKLILRSINKPKQSPGP